jgi:hypothetical protein
MMFVNWLKHACDQTSATITRLGFGSSGVQMAMAAAIGAGVALITIAARFHTVPVPEWFWKSLLDCHHC